MAEFTFTDSEERAYPYISFNGGALIAVPGQTYELDADPGDGRWTPASTPIVAPESPQTAPDAPLTGANPVPDQTPSPN